MNAGTVACVLRAASDFPPDLFFRCVVVARILRVASDFPPDLLFRCMVVARIFGAASEIGFYVKNDVVYIV